MKLNLDVWDAIQRHTIISPVHRWILLDSVQMRIRISPTIHTDITFATGLKQDILSTAIVEIARTRNSTQQMNESSLTRVKDRLSLFFVRLTTVVERLKRYLDGLRVW